MKFLSSDPYAISIYPAEFLNNSAEGLRDVVLTRMLELDARSVIVKEMRKISDDWKAAIEFGKCMLKDPTDQTLSGEAYRVVFDGLLDRYMGTLSLTIQSEYRKSKEVYDAAWAREAVGTVGPLIDCYAAPTS